jgi:hypothetical protein
MSEVRCRERLACFLQQCPCPQPFVKKVPIFQFCIFLSNRFCLVQKTEQHFDLAKGKDRSAYHKAVRYLHRFIDNLMSTSKARFQPNASASAVKNPVSKSSAGAGKDGQVHVWVCVS